jgi:hypothetical protein
MKKLLVVAVSALVLSLSGCGGADDVSNADEGSGSPTSPSTESPTTSETEPTEPTEATEPSDSTEPTSGTLKGGPYCDALQHAKEHLSDLDISQLDEDAFTAMNQELAKISAAAPADVKDDWATFQQALTRLHQLLASANISFDDLQQLQQGQLPPGVDPQELQRIAPKIQKISQAPRFQKAGRAISASAKRECHVSLD